MRASSRDPAVGAHLVCGSLEEGAGGGQEVRETRLGTGSWSLSSELIGHMSAQASLAAVCAEDRPVRCGGQGRREGSGAEEALAGIQK